MLVGWSEKTGSGIVGLTWPSCSRYPDDLVLDFYGWLNCGTMLREVRPLAFFLALLGSN